MIEIVSATLLILVRLLMEFDRMTLISFKALQRRYFIDWPLRGSIMSTFIIAVFAGLLSFLSPCVLPLVPAYVGYLSGRVVRDLLGTVKETLT